MTEEVFEFESSIPVIRMLNEKESRAFYLDYLGFETDWEHRFGETSDSPLYMQIRRGDAVLHLNGHAESDAPTTEVRIPVKGIEHYRDYLVAKDAKYETPEVVDPRYEGRNTDMNMLDPSNNHLVFWSRSGIDD